MPRLIQLFPAFLFCVLCAAAAQAAPVASLTLDDCDGNCNGADLTLEVEQQGSNWLVTYTIDTTDLDTDGGNRTGLSQIGFLVIKNWSDVQLQSAPNGLGNWTDPIHSVIHANELCEPTMGNSSKVCSAAENSFLDMTAPRGKYEFEFLVIGGTLLETEEWHFSGQWANQVGPGPGDVISDGAPIPEPSAALLFAIGAVTVGRTVRRRA